MTAAELLAVREHVGSEPSDGDIENLFATLLTSDAVARHILSTRLADLQSRPADFRVEGDYAEGWGKNIEALQKKVAALGGGGSSLVVGQLVRPERCR